MAQSATRVITKPAICPKRDNISSIGSTLAPHVLKRIVKTRKASMTSVYCQFGKVKVVFVISMAASTIVVTTKTELTLLASQPRVDIHPGTFSVLT